jgi:uncharacterized protein (DUF427 family)
VNNLVQATWHETILAESNQTIMVEGNHYFPPDSVNQQYFKPSDSRTMCSWKGLASYYDVEVEGKTNSNAAWYYESPRPAAKKIAGYVAFWHGVKVSEG